MGWVHLLDWVKTVVNRGARLQFVDTESDQSASRAFQEQVARLRDELGDAVAGELCPILTTGSLHEPHGNHLKGIFSERFALTGSMNVSMPGLTMHTELLTVRLSGDDGYQQLLPQIEQLWGVQGA